MLCAVFFLCGIAQNLPQPAEIQTVYSAVCIKVSLYCLFL